MHLTARAKKNLSCSVEEMRKDSSFKFSNLVVRPHGIVEQDDVLADTVVGDVHERFHGTLSPSLLTLFLGLRQLSG